jgi:hypothetical protein
MPIYEYQCKACDHRFETLQKMSEDVLTDCPVCSKSALTKLVSAAAFRLKGQGWYETDFKNSKQKGLAGDSGSEGGKGEGGKDSGVDKPAEKTAGDAAKASSSGSGSSDSSSASSSTPAASSAASSGSAD